eukprot:scaffold201533_cov32-Tisochrysis_lutea.AAC.3
MVTTPMWMMFLRRVALAQVGLTVMDLQPSFAASPVPSLEELAVGARVVAQPRANNGTLFSGVAEVSTTEGFIEPPKKISLRRWCTPFGVSQ